MRLLITRPEPAASVLAAELRARGHTVITAPIFEILDLPTELPKLSGCDAFILSSASGVAALARRTTVRNKLLFTVGPQTAAAARAAGFSNVHTGPGTGADLLTTLPAGITRCVHITAPEGKALTRDGIVIERAELYTSQPVSALPEGAAKALDTGKLDGALFFSPRSAKIFTDLADAAGQAKACASLTAFCISPQTANALAPVWNTVKIAARPNRAGLLELLQDLPPKSANG